MSSFRLALLSLILMLTGAEAERGQQKSEDKVELDSTTDVSADAVDEPSLWADFKGVPHFDKPLPVKTSKDVVTKESLHEQKQQGQSQLSLKEEVMSTDQQRVVMAPYLPKSARDEKEVS
eukprot:CAMPEP_0178452488 /NCGR_PEP_ID=MMETSP0689_2-20121128/44272_1 /TAXON_ID=160604 /ORGANISM="Amphidinium massartii, Strain CS-259" /LENGTH=119 /DNA_ID=CAMNT_0020078199 /DNA_START=97 /DNA_END=452 /DNA_ORIENTATION=+